MKEAKRKLVENNIIADLNLKHVDKQKLENHARYIIERNETTTLETAEWFYRETGIGTPCMDGMRY